MSFQIEIIGVDTYFGETETRTTILADATAVSATVTVYNLNLDYSQESEIVEYANFQQLNVAPGQIVGSMVTKPVFYPTSATKVSELFPEIVPLRKKFVYLFSTDYNVELKAYGDAGTAVNALVIPVASTNELGGNIKQKNYDVFLNKLIV